MESTPPNKPSARSPKSPSLVRRVLWIALLALLLFAGYKAIRTGLYGWTAYQHAMTLRQIANNGPAADDLPQIQTALQALSGALDGLEREMRPLAPLLRRLDFLPTYGTTIAAAPDLLIAGYAMTRVASDALTIIAPTMTSRGASLRLEILPALLIDAETQFAAMATHAQTAENALTRLPIAALHPALATPLTLAQPLLPVMAPGLRMAPLLPELLGFNGTRTYLLLVQNNHELRGTGGFLTAVGELTLDKGDIGDLNFADIYTVQRDDVEHAWAPEAMRRYMGVDLLYLRDANWSPDLPSSAQAIRALYAQDRGVVVDGVITIDLRAVELLVDALETLNVPGADAPLTGATIIDQIKQFWSTPLAADDDNDWWRSRKDFMPLLAKAALERVQQGELDYARAAQAVLRALDERAIQVWVTNSTVTAQLAELGWDGSLHTETGTDFISLIDSNLGYNKVDSVLTRKLDYQVTWPEEAGQPAIARATITYQHPLDLPNHQCDITPRYGTTYDDMAARCYFDYVRLYVPASSKLLSVDGVVPDTATSQRGEAKTQVFAGYFVLPPGLEQQITFRYRLPAYLTPDNYRLIIQRQSGTQPLPFTGTIAGQHIEATIQRGVFTWPSAQ